MCCEGICIYKLTCERRQSQGGLWERGVSWDRRLSAGLFRAASAVHPGEAAGARAGGPVFFLLCHVSRNIVRASSCGLESLATGTSSQGSCEGDDQPSSHRGD